MHREQERQSVDLQVELQKENVTVKEERKDGEHIKEFGKFQSADALLEAYTSLEAEFTRRSQKLKALESQLVDLQQVKAEKASNSPLDLQNQEPANSIQNMPEKTTATPVFTANREGSLPKDVHTLIENTVKACMHAHMQNSLPPILKETGGFAKAPTQKVASLEEAGRLAEAFLKNIK